MFLFLMCYLKTRATWTTIWAHLGVACGADAKLHVSNVLYASSSSCCCWLVWYWRLLKAKLECLLKLKPNKIDKNSCSQRACNLNPSQSVKLVK